MRDRKFYINSIKMDLYRVVTATGDTSKEAAIESTKEFLEHAINDFKHFKNTKHDLQIKKTLEELNRTWFKLNDPVHRIFWTEDVLTSRCRLVL